MDFHQHIQQNSKNGLAARALLEVEAFNRLVETCQNDYTTTKKRREIIERNSCNSQDFQSAFQFTSLSSTLGSVQPGTYPECWWRARTDRMWAAVAEGCRSDRTPFWRRPSQTPDKSAGPCRTLALKRKIEFCVIFRLASSELWQEGPDVKLFGLLETDFCSLGNSWMRRCSTHS